MSKMILGIDPGTTQSAYVLYTQGKIVCMGIVKNDAFVEKMKEICHSIKYFFVANSGVVYIEDVGCYGMPVGKEVFETVKFIGRLQQLFEDRRIMYKFVTRREIKLHFCNSMKAKDTNIRQALIDIFGTPGTKKKPGTLYGVKKDIWSALAIAVYGSFDLKERGE